ncbi:MAG: oligosaccharide flippase family protein [Bacteroidetes bacterium]|nr:oligosaccharide flippase family protein [Bacteroidota bacterium]
MSTIKKQGIQNTLITYIGVVIGFVSLMFIQPNLLKPEELGLTRILVAAASLLATILPLGVSSITTRYFPFFRNEDKRHHGYFGFMMLFPLVGTIVCGVLVYSFKDMIVRQYVEQSPMFTYYFDLILPFATIMGVNMALNAYSSSLFKTTIITFLEGILSRVLFIVLIVFYYFKLLSLSQFIHLFVFSYLLQTIWMCGYLYKIDRPSLKIDNHYLRGVGLNKLIGYGLFLTLSNVASLSLKHLDAVIIGKYWDLSYVGVFAVAAYISLIIEIPLNSLERISHSKVAQAFANEDFESIKKIYYQSVKYLMLVSGILLVGIISNVHELLGLLPEEYHKGATVTIISCCAAFLNVSTGVNTSIIFNSPKYLYGTVLLIVLMVLALIFNLWLIPVYGMIGAALVTGALAVLYNVTKFLLILIFYKMQPYDLSSLKILLVIGLSFGITFLLPTIESGIIAMVVKTSVITVTYVGLAYVMKIVPEFHKYLPFHKGD